MFRTYASSAPSLLSFGWVSPVQVSAVFWWVFNLKLYFLIWVDLEREKRVSREHFWFTFFEWRRVELLTVFDFHSEWERGRNIFFNQVISEIFVSKIFVTIRRDVTFNIRLVFDLFFPLFYALFCFNFCQRKKGRNIFFNQVISEVFVSKISVTIRRDVQHSFGVWFIFSSFFMLCFVSIFVSEKTKNDLIIMFNRERKKYEWLIKFLCYEL